MKTGTCSQKNISNILDIHVIRIFSFPVYVGHDFIILFHIGLYFKHFAFTKRLLGLFPIDFVKPQHNVELSLYFFHYLKGGEKDFFNSSIFRFFCTTLICLYNEVLLSQYSFTNPPSVSSTPSPVPIILFSVFSHSPSLNTLSSDINALMETCLGSLRPSSISSARRRGETAGLIKRKLNLHFRIEGPTIC